MGQGLTTLAQPLKAGSAENCELGLFLLWAASLTLWPHIDPSCPAPYTPGIAWPVPYAGEYLPIPVG